MEITISSSPDHFLEQHFLDKAQAQGNQAKGSQKQVRDKATIPRRPSRDDIARM
jgi:hypothetical protein